MKSSGPLFLALLVTTAVIALGCGSSNADNSQPPSLGQLQSITLSPAVANANDYPNGDVQFVATGYYKTPPSPVTPLIVQTWGACQANNPTSEVTVSSNGLAQCAEGATGTYSVFASVLTDCNVIGPCGSGCYVTGTAQLTCP